MFSFELQKTLASVDNFIGVFSIDTIPNVGSGKMVINIDSSNLPGTHWVALHITKQYIIYFDSLAHPILPIILNKLIIHNKSLYVSCKALQTYLQSDCGKHCLNFIKYEYPSPFFNFDYYIKYNN